MSRRTWFRVARPTIALAMLVLLLAFAPAASAHAGLESSDPADGAVVPDSPTQIVLTFTEPPDPDLSIVRLLDAGGAPVTTGDATVTAGKTLTVPIPEPLADGVYTVIYRVVSSADGHVTAGAFAFGVGDTAAPAAGSAAAPEAPGPTVVSVAGKALLYAGLALLLALAVVGLGLFGGGLRASRVATMAAALAALAGAILVVAAEVHAVGVPTRELLRSATGRPFLWLLVAVLAADACAVLAAARDRPWAGWLAGVAAAIAMFVRASGGHAAAVASPLLNELLQWIHFLAVGVWIGGLVVLWLWLRERREQAGSAEVNRFSGAAVVAVGVLVLTGVLRAADELGGFGWVLRAFDTSYGTTLLIKVALAVGLIGLGAINRYRSIPRLATDPRPLRRMVSAEIVTAIGLFALTATLTGLPPQGNAQPPLAPSPATVVAEGADFATTVRAHLTLEPGAPGHNHLHLEVRDYDTGSPAPADAVTLLFDSVSQPDLPASELDLTREGDAWTGSGTEVSVAGTWVVTARITTGSTATEVPLVITTAVAGATTDLAEAPGQPTIVTVTQPDGTAIQAYVDPGAAGPNQVHLTAFDAGGAELSLRSAAFVALPSSGSPVLLDAVRFDPGHFVANTDLETGDWMFDLTAQARDGTSLQATFDQTI